MAVVWPTPTLSNGVLVDDEDWNTHVDNLNDLDSRVTSNANNIATNQGDIASNAGDIASLQTLTSDAAHGNLALDTRVTALEDTPPGSAITMAGFLDLDPNTTGFTPTPGSNGTPFQVYNAGGGTYIEFSNPGEPVTVSGIAMAHGYANTSGQGIRVGMKVEISMDGGVTWTTSANTPLSGAGGGTSASERTAYTAGQFSLGGTPTGAIRVRALAYCENDATLFRATLSATVMGGISFTTG